MTDTLSIIIGNVSSIGAMVCDSISGTRKTKKSMLLVQCGSQFFYCASAIILKGYSAAVQNVVAVVRNLVAIRDKTSRLLEYILIILPVVLGLVFNNRGLIGLLPIIANLQYSIAVFAFRDSPRKLKLAFIINSALFIVFNFAILNFVAGVSAIVISVTTTVSLVKEIRAEKAAK